MKPSIALLDVNVLVALFDPDHLHHEPAHRWFENQRLHGWATCPLTENALIRVLSNPAYTPNAELPSLTVARLRTFREGDGHTFWPADVSLSDPGVLVREAPLSHRNLTDLYLLSLAVRRNGRLATFEDRKSVV